MMEKKMGVMGVGAKIAIALLIYVAATVVLNWIEWPSFLITDHYTTLLIIGIALIVVGFGLNLVAAFTMLKATKENRLATGGLYAIFRDPMYVLQIFLTLPGLFLLFNSWLVLSGIIPGYFFYRVFVREEHTYLESKFGEEYREYVKKVPIKI